MADCSSDETHNARVTQQNIRAILTLARQRGQDMCNGRVNVAKYWKKARIFDSLLWEYSMAREYHLRTDPILFICSPDHGAQLDAYLQEGE